MRSRCTLHKSKLLEFQDWLESLGWNKEQCKGDYEVLRMRRDKGEIITIYDRSNAIEHYTTFGMGNRFVHKWLRGRKHEN